MFTSDTAKFFKARLLCLKY